MADPSSLISITEVGEAGGLRAIELRGAALPFQGAEWGGAQRVNTTWYPGNGDEATQHVLGPTELPSNWQGEWNTTRMIRAASSFFQDKSQGSGEPITRASTLRDILEDIFRSGNLLEVIWVSGGDGRHILREGRAVEWRFSHDRMDDIRWTVTYDWKGRGGRQQRAAQFRGDPKQVSATEELQNAMDEVAALLDASELNDRRSPVSTFNLGQIEALLDIPSDITRQFTRKALQISNRLGRVANLAKKGRAIPFQVLNQILDVAQNAMFINNQFIDDMSRRPPELNTTKRKLADLTRSTEFFGNGIRGSQVAANASRRLRTRLTEVSRKRFQGVGVATARGGQDVQQSDIKNIVPVREGTTFLKISLKEYGVDKHGPTLARVNGFPLHQIEVPPGTVIIVPTLDAVKTFDPFNG